MSRDEWLDSRPIADRSLDPAPRSGRGEASRDPGSASYAALNHQLEALSDRLERLGSAPTRGAARPAASRRAGDDDGRLSNILATLDGIDQRIQGMRQPDPRARERAASSPSRGDRDRPLLDRPIYDRDPRRSEPAALSRDIDAIASRRDALDGRVGRDRYEADRLTREDIDDHFRALSGQIDALRRDGPTAAIERLQDDIAVMKAELRRRDPVASLSDRDVTMIRAIAEKVDTLSRSRANGEEIDRLCGEFAELRRLVMANDVESSLQSLESGYRHIVERLDDMRRSMGDPEILDRVSSRIGDIDRAMKAIPQIEQIAAIEKQIGRLGDQIDALGNIGDPRLDSIENQLNDMRQALASVDTGQAVVALGRQLQTITEKLDILEAAEREPVADPVSTQMIDRLANQIADIRALVADDHHSDNFRVLSERIGDISAKLDAAEKNRDTRAGFAALDRRIAELGERLEAPRDMPGQDLSGLEARLEQAMAQIDKLVPQADMGGTFSALEARIAEIGTKIDKFDPSVPARDLEALWNLEKTLERIDGALRRTSESTALDQLDDKVSALSERLDAISSKPIDLSEVTELRNEITDMREQFARPIPVDMSVFEKQIRALVEQISNAPASDNREELRRLEEQIVSITRILDATDARFATLSTIEDALSRIQSHLSDSHSDTAGIAREAARAAVEEFSTSRPSAAGPDDQIRSLQEDLKRFLSTSHDSAERTQDTLVSLHDTLQSVAARLAKLEAEAPAMAGDTGIDWADREPVAEAQPMPRRRVGDEHYEPPVFANGTPDDGLQEPMTAAIREQSRFVDTPASDHMARALADEELNRSARVAADASARTRPEDNMPLEPGSGRPRVPRSGRPGEAPRADAYARPAEPPFMPSTEETGQHSSLEAAVRDRKADFIAAARRAAQAAAANPSPDPVRSDEGASGGKSWLKSKFARKTKKAEIEPEVDAAPSLDEAAALYTQPPRAEQPLAGDDESDEIDEGKSRSGGLFGVLRKHRRPLLMGVAGLVFVLVGLEAMKIMLAPSAPQVAMQQPPAEQTEAATDEATTAAVPTTSGKTYNEPIPSSEPPRAAQPSGVAMSIQPEPEESAMPATTAMAPETPAAPAADATTPVAAIAMPPEAIGPLALRQDAANGDPDAQFEIAARYTSGIGVKTDLSEAAIWYQRAAAQGNGPAQYRLGSLYEKGTGIKKDVGEAKRWYQRSAEQGNIKAMHNLAVLYAEGADGAPDLTTAAQWFERAAERGVRDSQFNLGILYTRGLGVPRDLTNAYKWFALAAIGGDADAGKKRDEIANALDRQGLAAARLAVETWRPKTIVEAANKPKPMPAKWSTGVDRQASSSAPATEGTELISQAQALLSQLGYDPGPSDGVPGPRTRDAVKAFQRSIGAPETGIVDPGLIQRMAKSVG